MTPGRSKLRRGPPVAACMAVPVYSCQVSDSLQVVAELMRDLGCGCLPVTDEEGHAIGVVTRRDICDAAARDELALAAMTVESAMSSSVVSCLPDEPLSVAVARMGTHRVRRLPVVDSAGLLVGLLSLQHVARGLAEGADLGLSAGDIVAALVGTSADTSEEATEKSSASLKWFTDSGRAKRSKGRGARSRPTETPASAAAASSGTS